MSIKQKIALRIIELRMAKGLKQEQLAWDSNLDRSFMCQVEKGVKNISMGTLCQIIEGLQTNLKEFFGSEIFNNQLKP